MPIYMYKAITKTGVVVSNTVEFANKVSLIQSIKKNDLVPISIEEISNYTQKTFKRRKRNITDIQDIMEDVNTTQLGNDKTKEKINSYFVKYKKVTQEDLMIFTKNFCLLKKSNLNNVHALDTIIQSTENLFFRDVLEDILAGVKAGENMYTTMEYYSDIFPYIYTNIIKNGELSGTLTNSFEQAIVYLEKTEVLNSKLKSILIPNIVQFILLIIMLLVGTLFAIPMIQRVFGELGTENTLPAITVWFVDFVMKIFQNWYILAILIVGIVTAIVLYIRTPKGKYKLDQFKYKMPIFGELIFALDFSTFIKAMLLNLKNGMTIQESMEASKNVIKNLVMLFMIEGSIHNLEAGDSFIDSLKKSGLAKPVIIEMLNIGMKTDLTEVMEKLVEYMEIDIDNIINKIMKEIPQIVYSIIGIALILFILIVLIPCVQIYMGNFLFSAMGV